MADPRFFSRAGPFTLAELARVCGAGLVDGEDAAKLCRDVAPLETAGPDEASFLENRKYLPAFRCSRAGAAGHGVAAQ
jgi:UDP-3-O-[3-hydroxymyristoyl] glucosamine N-acyltransferase